MWRWRDGWRNGRRSGSGLIGRAAGFRGLLGLARGLAFGVALAVGTVTGCMSPYAYYSDGVAAMQEKPPRYEEAIQAFTEVLGEKPDSDIAYVNRGDAYFALGRMDEARQDYDRAIELLGDARNPWYFNRRGLTSYRQGRYREANADWLKAKELEQRLKDLGYKTKKSETYMKMLDERERLLVDVEQQIAALPAAGAETEAAAGDTAAGDTAAGDTAAGDTAAGDTAAGDTAAGDTAAGDTAAGDTAAGDTAVGDTAAGDTEVTAGDTDTATPGADTVAPGTGLTEEQLAAISRAEAQHVLLQMEAEAKAAADAEAKAAADAEAKAAADAEAKAAADAEAKAAADAEAKADADATVADTGAPTADATAGTDSVAVRPLSAEEEAALAEARALHELKAMATDASTDATVAGTDAAAGTDTGAEGAAWPGEDAAKPAAAVVVPARPKPSANLTGTWKREDGLTFQLVDDGRRVIGEVSGSSYFVFYEVTMEWKDANTLQGIGVFKEKVTSCQFEASVGWKLTVKDKNTLGGSTEEVGWSEDCQENYRDWVEYSFLRQ